MALARFAGVSFSEWLGVVQAVATVLATWFAWRALVEAGRTRREAAAEKRRASLLELRAILGEIRRLWSYGYPTPQKDREKERLRAMLRVVGGEKKFPKTAPITHFAMPHGVLTDEGVAMLDNAEAEIDAAIDAAFG